MGRNISIPVDISLGVTEIEVLVRTIEKIKENKKVCVSELIGLINTQEKLKKKLKEMGRR